jgi:YHS domain-containing protein
MVEDPVCKVYVPKGRSLVLHLEGGKTEHFCSPACRDLYKEKVLKRTDPSAE